MPTIPIPTLMTAALFLSLAACSVEAVGEPWDEIDPAALTASADAAVYLSFSIFESADSDEGGTLAVINRDTGVQFIATGKLDNGPVRLGSDGTLSWASETTSYLITPTAKHKVTRGGLQATGDSWSPRPVGGAQLFNSGASDHGYATDAYAWTADGQLRHTEALTTPGPSGFDGSTAYVANAGDEDERTLVKVTPGEPAQSIARWQPDTTDGWLVRDESQAVIADGKFWYIEEASQFKNEEELITQADGTKTLGRLANIDLESGKYETRVFTKYEGASREELSDGSLTPAGYVAFEAGHGTQSDRFHFLDRDGRICALTIPDAHQSCTEKTLPSRTLNSDRNYADWHGDRLWLLLYNDEVWMESYDLDTGEQLTAQRLPELEAFRKEHPTRFAWDFAARPTS